MSTPRTLSKGTLGLKFMNKIKPVDPAAPPAPSTPVASTSSAPITKPVVAREIKKEASVVNEKEQVKVHVKKEDVLAGASPSRKRQIIQEGSLLSFPLLGTSPSSSQFTAASYSSMPLTSVAISGRRSFGGANKEIEKLNNPPPPSAPVEVASDEPQPKKKRKSDTSFLDDRARQKKAPSSFKSNSDEIKLRAAGPSEVRRHGVDKRAPAGFAKPKGFEDVRASLGKKKMKGEDPFHDHSWDAPGVTREWDVGKALESSDADEDEDEDEDEENGSETEFKAALDDLLKGAAKGEDALMEAEKKWDEGEDEKPKKRSKKSKQGAR